MRLHRHIVTFATLALLSPAAGAQEAPAQPPHPFPPDDPIAPEVDPGKLKALGEFVRDLCESDELIGGELLVIKNGRTLLHEAYGWLDREAEQPMVTDTVFCVRSMTKPVIGTAIHMLVDEGKLELSDPVSKYLSSFDNDGSGAITVEQLLWHTGGLPLSVLTPGLLEELEDITAVAALAGEQGPEFEPGERFWYSDPGADTLAAVVQAASGVPLEDFVRERILEPLGMQDSTCRMSAGHPLRERGCSSYVGRRGDWSRYWTPADEPIFPFFLGSQSLYSTPVDYARFLDLWLKRGRHDGERLLSMRAMRRALEPGPHQAGLTTGFAGLRGEYGHLWQLWIDPEQRRRGGLVAFGHGGSDGTQAWALPAERLMVLLFTQSRGHGVGMLVEEKVDQVFRGTPFDPDALTPELGPYLGLYEDVQAGLYLAVIEEEGRLAIEMPGRFILETRYAGEERWKLVLDPRTTFSFGRREDGAVDRILAREPDGEAELTRLIPSSDLPGVDEVIEQVRAAHRIDRLSETGAVRLTGVLEMPARQMEGRITQLYAAPDRYLMEIDRGTGPQRVAWDGQTATVENDLEGWLELEGMRREQARLESFVTLVRDWRLAFQEIAVLMRIPGTDGGEARLVIRATPRVAHPVTLIVGEESGRLLGHRRISEAPTIGRMGVSVTYEDFREVGGMLLPFRQASKFPTAILGTVTARFEEVETGVEVSAADFVIEAQVDDSD